jgi:IS5 family transposase
VDFKQFCPDFERAVRRGDGSKGDRPAFDHVLMFKILLLQAMHGLSDERNEYLIKDRLSFMRFLGLDLAECRRCSRTPTPCSRRRANSRKLEVRSRVERVFAHQKGIVGLMVRTVGIARADVKIGLSNLAYNIRRLVWLSTMAAPA